MATRAFGPDGLGGESLAATEQSMLSFFRMLAEAPDGDSVAHAICRGVLPTAGTELVTIYVADPDGDGLNLSGQWGLERELAHLYAQLPMDLPSPERDAFRTGVEAFVSVRTVAAEYPMAAAYLKAHPGQARSQAAYLPLRHRGVPIGVLGMRFPQPIQRTWQLRATLDALTSGVTLWALARTATRTSAESRKRQREIQVSNRQRQVLELVRGGKTNAEIARTLGFSEVTIKADLTALYKLLGATGRGDLIERATRAGL